MTYVRDEGNCCWKVNVFPWKKALGEGREGEYEVAKVLYILRTYLNKLTLLE